MLKFLSILVAAFAFSLPLYFGYQSEAGLKSRSPAQAPFHSATEQEMENPRCINQDHVRRNDLKSFIKKYSDISNLELPAIYEVSGIRFENEHPELVYRFMQLVTPQAGHYYANKDLKPDTIRKAFGAPNGCTKVLCAVQRIFGQEEGPLMLLLLTEYDLNLSHYVWSNADRWKASEIRDILKSIEAVPSHLLPLDLNQKLSHFKRGYGYSGGGDTIANASIELFDVWNEMTPPIRQYSVYHEFSHNWSYLHANDIDVSPEWLKVSGWEPQAKKSTRENWRMHPGTQQVSIYAKTNPFEDFAESVSAYRYAPERLKKVSAAKYKFVKDIVYGGLEFTGACPKSGEVSAVYEKDFAAFDSTADSKFVQTISTECFKKNLGLLKNPSLKSGYLSCLSLRSATEVLNNKGQTNAGETKPLGLFDALGGARIRFQSVERRGVLNLQDSVVDVLKPHLKAMQQAVDLSSCKNAFEPLRTEEQAVALGAKNYEIYFGIQELTTRVCQDFVASGDRRVSAETVKNKLKRYF
ncbi:hypothetical protein [Bdellovibrio svalbardensis]|uniref:Uncharacterized protein n=1 Tax=Bdellovibrio svalbardensis TaxID=2972972 RepID=A0ABT6DK49_9BACT|nr:hypothetical protein [Bdellovibrio svalbardensis]MDG0817026.1 hypothetical protein [Bdellovibrio svalbardensis]